MNTKTADKNTRKTVRTSRTADTVNPTKYTVKRLTVLSMLCAIAIASRYALSAFPNFKPVLAIVVIAGVAMGVSSGITVGCVSMLISNFIFGQGLHTPFQMLGMALVGLAAGLIFKKVPVKFWTLAAFGGLSALLIYAPIMNFYSMLTMSKELSFKMFMIFEISALPFDFSHAIASVLILGFAGMPLIIIINKHSPHI
jgi:hypothetical protein